MNIHEYQAKQVLKGFGAPVAHDVQLHAVHGPDPGVHAALMEVVGAKEIAPVGQGDSRRTIVHRGAHEVGEPGRRGQQAVLAVRVKVDEGRHVTRCQ